MRPDIMTPREVADEWGCSEKHVRNMVNRGELRHFRLGGKLLRIPRSAVEEAECAMMVSPTRSDCSKESAPSVSGSPSMASGSGNVSALAPAMRPRPGDVLRRYMREPSGPKANP